MSGEHSKSELPSSDRRSLRFKILRDHQKGCGAVDQVRKRHWGTPWAFLKEVQYRDGAGRLQTKNKWRGRRWWLIGCNSIGCRAEIVVEETSILEGLPRD